MDKVAYETYESDGVYDSMYENPTAPKVVFRSEILFNLISLHLQSKAPEATPQPVIMEKKSNNTKVHSCRSSTNCKRSFILPAFKMLTIQGLK